MDIAASEARYQEFTNLHGLGIEMMSYGLFSSEKFNKLFVDRITMDPVTFRFWYQE